MDVKCIMASLKIKKDFLPTILLIVGLWILLFLMIFFVDPTSSIIVYVFLVILSLAIFLTSSLVLKNKRRGLIITLSIITYLTISYLGLGNILNLILVFGSALAFEIYFSTRA